MKILKKKNILLNNKVENIFKITGGTTPSTTEHLFWKDGNIPWIGPVDMNKTGKYISHGRKNITEIAANKIISKKIPKNSIILSTRAPIGYVKINKNDIFTNQGCHSLSLNNNKYNSHYFYYYFLNKTKKLYSISKGSTFKEIGKKELGELFISYFEDIYQQEKIAHVLSMQEEQIERIKGLLQKLEKRNQYYAEKLLSGELRIKENSETGQIEFYENEEWQEVVLNGEKCKIPLDWKIENILNIMNFSNGSTIKSEDLNYHNKGLPYLRTNEIWDSSTVNKNKVYFNGNLNNLELKNKDEYIVCFDGFNTKPGIGTLGLVTNNGEGICSNELKKIKNIEGISEYYVNVMILKNIRFQKTICKYAEGTTVKHAGKHIKHLKEVLIPIKEQKILNVYFQENLQKIDQLKNILPKEEKRFQWMLDNLLSGEYEIVD